jgi:Fic family protein
MKPPYDLTTGILKLISAISAKLGELSANRMDRPSPQLRKQNRIKTIHASLKIEGNTLTQEQVTALINQNKVVGPRKDILEVINAIKVYEALPSFKSSSQKSFLQAHRMLMDQLVLNPGKYRKEAVGIYHGTQVAHIAPPASQIPYLMMNLFNYLKDTDELTLIKSCVFHYELEFIHPFMDGNGRMGRLWQSVILMKEYPIFEFLPIESLIIQSQNEYYLALSQSDKQGKSTVFLEYMLDLIDKALHDHLQVSHQVWKDTDRLHYFMTQGYKEFSRKDYMNVFRNISTATASRDLQKGVAMNLFQRSGDKNKTTYSTISKR